MPQPTFRAPDLTTFARLDELGLYVTGQHVTPARAVLECRPTPSAEEAWCERCGCEGRPRDTVVRQLAHEPFGHRPTTLVVRVRRYRCTGCTHVWRQDLTKAAAPRARLSRRALAWALEALVLDHLPVSRIAASLAVAWDTANDAVLTEGRTLFADPTRFDGVSVLGVDEHVWRHTKTCDKYVTVIIDLTPVRAGTGPARLLDMVEGRSKAVFKTWLASRPKTWRDKIQIVAMDGFTGFKTAAAEEVPAARAVMDPFHVVRLAGDGLDECRRRTQQALHHRRGRKGDPLYAARRTLHTGANLLTDKQTTRLNALFGCEEHTSVEATWWIYQHVVAAYRAPTPTTGKTIMTALIDTILARVPTSLIEVTRLARTLTRRRADVLAYFDHPHTSNGPTEAINGRLEHLRGTALGFRNLTHYIARSLLHAGGFRPRLHPALG